jgi:hypothetical protein
MRKGEMSVSLVETMQERDKVMVEGDRCKWKKERNVQVLVSSRRSLRYGGSKSSWRRTRR